MFKRGYEYDVNPEEYDTIMVEYIMRRYKKSKEEAKKILKQVDKNRKNPLVTCYDRDIKTLDFTERKIPLTDYIKDVKKRNWTMAPSFTTYTKVDYNGNKYISIHSKYTMENKKIRSEYKYKAKLAEIKENKVEYEYYNTLQQAKKDANNGLSGVYTMLYLPIARHSSHYSLTSYTRLLVSTANTIAESMASGNRFYLKEDDILNHFTTIIHYTDFKKLEYTVRSYNLYIPTVKDIMGMVYHTTQPYFSSDFKYVKRYLSVVSKMERVAILYTYDLYHLVKFNSHLFNSLFGNIISPYERYGDASELLKEPEWKRNILHRVKSDIMLGKGIDYSDISGKSLYALLGTMDNITNTFNIMKHLISTFFLHRVVPPNISKTKYVLRKAVVLSDTDSTCYTVVPIMRYLLPSFEYNSKSIGYSGIISTIVTETIRSYLKQLAMNMNIDKDRWGEIDMKSEFFWSIFAPLFGSKHYWEISEIKELYVLLNKKIKVHGVNLITSKVDDIYTSIRDKIMELVVDAYKKGNHIHKESIINLVIEEELKIIELIKTSPFSVLKTETIKKASDYKDKPYRSRYTYYLLYNEVFKDRYGAVPKPPYNALKLPLTTTTKKRMDEYIDSLDEDIANRFRSYLDKSGKKYLGTIYLNAEIIKYQGIPKEIIPIINTNMITETLLQSVYLALTTLGITKRDGLLYEQFGII